MDKHQSKITILICLAISIVVIFFGLRTKGYLSGNHSTPPPIPEAQASQPAIVVSPDGKMSLTMKKNTGENVITYSFLVTNKITGSQKEIFTKTVPTGVEISIPDNTFSSDNKYIFLKEESLDTANYFVLFASGAPVTKDAQTFDISDLFAAKYQDFIITDVTGWAGPTLVVINTDKVGGGTGPSFWFDAGSHSFIRLSSRFN